MKPTRESVRNNGQTYFVTFQTSGRKPLFRHAPWANLLLEVLQNYQDKFDLHDFVLMHDHVHLLITPHGTLEKSVQLIKGGYSFRAKRHFNWKDDIWQVGFTDHRIRDERDCKEHRAYIQKNIESLLTERHPFCAANADFSLTEIPHWLKPQPEPISDGQTELQPLPSS